MDLPVADTVKKEYTPSNGVVIPDKPKQEIKPPTDHKHNDYSKDVNDLDDILSDLNIERETFEPTPENPYSKEAKENKAQENAFGFQDDLPDNDEPIDENIAKKNGMNMARVVSSLNAWLTSRIGKDKMEKYKCSDEELDELAEVYSDISQSYNMKMPPWISAVIVSVFILGPKWADAKEARDMRIKQDETEQLRLDLESERNMRKELHQRLTKLEEKEPEKG